MYKYFHYILQYNICMDFFLSFWINLQFLLRPYWCNVAHCPKPERVVSVPLDAERLTALVNNWRVSQGFQPYRKLDILCQIAQSRTKDGLDHHIGLPATYHLFNQKSFISENLTQGNDDKDALDRWLGSPPHKEALEKPYIYSCIATKGQFAVQIFSNCENGC